MSSSTTATKDATTVNPCGFAFVNYPPGMEGRFLLDIAARKQEALVEWIDDHAFKLQRVNESNLLNLYGQWKIVAGLVTKGFEWRGITEKNQELFMTGVRRLMQVGNLDELLYDHVFYPWKFEGPGQPPPEAYMCYSDDRRVDIFVTRHARRGDDLPPLSREEFVPGNYFDL